MRINDESIDVNKTKIYKKIFEGTKIFELRRKIFLKKINTVVIYESSPTKNCWRIYYRQDHF